MRDRLRRLWNRPLRDGERGRLFVLAVVVIAGAAMALALLDEPGRAPHPRTVRAAEHPSPAARTSTVPSATAPSRAPSEVSRPSTGSHGTRTDVADSKRAARHFLEGYLPYLYGRERADRLAAVSAQLRAELAAYPPRQMTGGPRGAPRLELLQSNGVGPRRADLLALVDDGVRRYPVPLYLTKTADGWLVTGLGS